MMSRELNLFVIFQYLLILTSQSSIIIVEDHNGEGCGPCYRKLFAGKRLAEIHIRRAIDCEQIEDCSRECDSERGFSCEGFNYRHIPVHANSPPGRDRVNKNHGICELTSMQPSQIDIVRDIHQEPRYDYYERYSGCQNKRPARPPVQIQSGWINVRPSQSSRPQEDRPYLPRPIEIPRPLLPPDRGPGIDIPRPNFGHDYLPKRRYQGDRNQPQRPWRPDNNDDNHHLNSYPQRIPGLNIRPIEDEVRYGYFRPERPHPHPSKDRRPDIWYKPQQNDFGINEIDHYQPGRKKDSINRWGSGGYGGVYGGSYGYNMNNIDGYDNIPKRGNDLNYHKRPFENTGDVYNYGGAYGYGGDNHVSHHKDHFHPGYKPQDYDCSVRAGAGFKLRRGIVRKSYLTPTLDQCENLCAVEKDCLCMTFSYRYSLAANAPTDNCLLSEISYRDLDFYTDLEPDRDYDIYSMTGDPKSCGKERPVDQRPPEECFWRVRSGCGVPPEVVRKSILAQGIGDCEAECVDARLFTCRSFVYRHSEVHSPDDGSPNCFLSDWPSQEIDPLSLPEVNGAELYQRGSFGRGCEPSPFPPLNHHSKRPEPDNRPMKKDEVCYAEYKKPCRLTPQAVMLTIYVHSEYECRERCSEMRERDPVVPCMSFSYRISSDRDEHNCFMSDVPRRDLRPGIDYTHGDGHFLFAWKDFDPQCDSGYSIGIIFDNDDRGFPPKRPISTGLSLGQDPRPYSSHFEPPFDIEQRPVRPHGNPYPLSPDFSDQKPFGPGGYGAHRPNSRPSNDGGYDPPGRPINPDRPDPVGPGYGGGGAGDGNSYDTDGRFGHGYSDDRYNDFSHKHGGSTFQHFTVNGHPCKRGTKCERNKIAGFWSCEPEGGEFGTWDYCCEPNHHCGYSQGYHYPWCYVGPYEDQWRPCSEQYYPYLPSHRPIRPSSDRYDENDAYGEVPRPGMLGRHWPVAYLHREAPPNATDSFAAADSRRNRKLHNVISTVKLNGTNSLARVRGNYILKSSTDVIKDWIDPANYHTESQSTSENLSRAGKIERVTRFSESRVRNSSALTLGRNSTNADKMKNDRNGAEDLKDDKIVEFKDFKDYEENKTPDSGSSNWRGTTFIRLPTISPNNKTQGNNKFEDYFEVVNVE